MRTLLIAAVCLLAAVAGYGQGDWHRMNESELRAIVPEKAPVIRENIETEFRTAAGISDGKRNVFGVVIITAGYEADGKYTHYFRTDADLKLADLDVPKGQYIFGYQRLDTETLRVTFYKAADGELIGAVKAKVEAKKGAIYSFLIDAPVDSKGKIYIGRFVIGYQLK